jgi:hypothetical protein
MTQHRHVEAHVFNADPTILETFQAAMPGLDVRRAPGGRGVDVLQIIEIAGDVSSIVAGLIALKSLLERGPKVEIVIRTEAGDAAELDEAGEDELRKTIEPPPD